MRSLSALEYDLNVQIKEPDHQGLLYKHLIFSVWKASKLLQIAAL